MKRLAVLAFLALLLPALAHAQTGTPQTPAQLNAEINGLFPDNSSGLISPAALRQATLDMVASGLGGTTISGTPAAGYVQIATSATTAVWSGSYFPGLTTSVNGTGKPGLDNTSCTGVSNCGWFIRQVPITTGGAVVPNLTLDRAANYTGGVNGTVVQSLFAFTTTSRTGAYYEWPILSQMINQTEATTGAQNVAINGTAAKQYAPTFSAEIGPTWAGNFNCIDFTGRVDPSHGCVGIEIDAQALKTAGTDANRQRVPLQLAWFSTTGDATSSLHFGVGILLGAGDGSTMDNGMLFAGSGPYGNLITATSSGVNGINLNSATFSGGAFLSPNVVIDGVGRFTIQSGSSGGNAMSFTGNTVGNYIIASGTSTNGVNMNTATFSGSAFLSPGFAISGTGAVTATLPASAGGGGLYVCVDTSGAMYKKSACP